MQNLNKISIKNCEKAHQKLLFEYFDTLFHQSNIGLTICDCPQIDKRIDLTMNKSWIMEEIIM